MAKIQCPHCGAINQDVSLDQPCLKCGTILGAPGSALETGDGPPASEANRTNKGGSADAITQKRRTEDAAAGDAVPIDETEGGERRYE